MFQTQFLFFFFDRNLHIKSDNWIPICISTWPELDKTPVGPTKLRAEVGQSSARPIASLPGRALTLWFYPLWASSAYRTHYYTWCGGAFIHQHSTGQRAPRIMLIKYKSQEHNEDTSKFTKQRKEKRQAHDTRLAKFQVPWHSWKGVRVLTKCFYVKKILAGNINTNIKTSDTCGFKDNQSRQLFCL